MSNKPFVRNASVAVAGLAMLGLWLWEPAKEIATKRADSEPKPDAHDDHAGHAHAPVGKPPRSHAASPSTGEGAPAADNDEQEPALHVPGESLQGDVQFVVGIVQAKLQDQLDDDKRFPELAHCRASNGDCAALLSKAIDDSLAWPIVPELATRKNGLDSLLTTRRPAEVVKQVRASAHEILSRSEDPLERASALALLERVTPEVPDAPRRALPSEAYRDLGKRTDPEARMLLRAYQGAHAEDLAVASQIEAIALDGTRAIPLRAQAVRALGHPETRAQLESVVGTLRGKGAVNEAMARGTIGPALAGCGSACDATFVQLAKSASPSERRAAQFAVTFSKDPRTRAQWLAELREVVPEEQLTSAERDQLAYLERSVKAETQ